MNKFDKSKQYQQFGRSSDIEVSKGFVTKLESLALSAFVSGNMDAYVLAMNSLTKLQAQHDMSNMIGNLNVKLDKLNADLGNE